MLARFGVQALWTQDTLALVLKCLTDILALDSLSTYIEDQSHCILGKGKAYP